MWLTLMKERYLTTGMDVRCHTIKVTRISNPLLIIEMEASQIFVFLVIS